LRELLTIPRFVKIRLGLRMITYPHDEQITAALSSACDLRIVWGGDATVATLRRIPLPPKARELVFADRFSFAVVSANAYLALDETARRALGDKLYNDAMWFDQLGCSSPRLIIWVGEEPSVDAASPFFFQAVHEAIQNRAHHNDLGATLQKLTFAYGSAIDRPIRSYKQWSNELTVMRLENLDEFNREHCGAGLFFEARVGSLDAIVPFVRRKDQTLVHWGFDEQPLRSFAERLAGRGIDRMVPLGQALAFNRFWDGYDLMQEMTRRIFIQAQPSSANGGSA
jgi:hypothetical protein